MAIPPEPIDEVLPRAEACVLAEVVGVTDQPDASPANQKPVAGRQLAELKVTAVLFGTVAKVGATVRALKPAGAYALRAGNKGPFLLAGTGEALEIVGRYGPDTYSEDVIRQAMARAGKTRG